MIGADRVTRLLVNITRKGLDRDAEMHFTEVNRTPSLVISWRGQAQIVVAIEEDEGRVQATASS